MARALPTFPFALYLVLANLILSTTAFLQPTIYEPGNSSQYSYVGCYQETTEIPNTDGDRALNNGDSRVLPEYMTVPRCLDFCGGQTGVVYKFAGLEYSRECWCAQTLNGLSLKLNDSACDLQCDGDETQLCGGRLKLSLYSMPVDPTIETMANTSTIGSISTLGSSSGKSSNSTTGNGLTLQSSSARMAVLSWMMPWVVAAIMMMDRE